MLKIYLIFTCTFLITLFPYFSNTMEQATTNQEPNLVSLQNSCVALKAKLTDLQQTLAGLKPPEGKSIALPRTWALPGGYSIEVTFDQEKKEYLGEIKDKGQQAIATLVCPVQEKELVFYGWLVYQGSIPPGKAGEPHWSKYEKINLYKSNIDGSWLIGGDNSKTAISPAPTIPIALITKEIMKKLPISKALPADARKKYLNTYQSKNFWMGRVADDGPFPDDMQLNIKAFIEILWPVAQGKEPS